MKKKKIKNKRKLSKSLFERAMECKKFKKLYEKEKVKFEEEYQKEKEKLEKNFESSSKRKYILGLDPGKDGGIVLISKKTGKIAKMLKVPRIKKEVDEHAFNMIFKKYRKKVDYAFLEKPNRGGSFAGRTQAQKLGESIQLFRSALVSNDIRFVEVRPTEWQKVMLQGVSVIEQPKKETKEEKAERIKKNKTAKRKRKTPKIRDNKSMALIAAKRLFIDESFIPEGSRKPHDGLVDAALIGLYGLWKIYKGEK